jgi:hypothetical protein
MKKCTSSNTRAESASARSFSARLRENVGRKSPRVLSSFGIKKEATIKLVLV